MGSVRDMVWGRRVKEMGGKMRGLRWRLGGFIRPFFLIYSVRDGKKLVMI